MDGHKAASTTAEELAALDHQRQAIPHPPETPEQSKQLASVLKEMAEKHTVMAGQITKQIVPHL